MSTSADDHPGAVTLGGVAIEFLIIVAGILVALGVDNIRARRVELLPLARNESAVATAQWYALTRLKLNFEELLSETARRDGTLTPAKTRGSTPP